MYTKMNFANFVQDKVKKENRNKGILWSLIISYPRYPIKNILGEVEVRFQRNYKFKSDFYINNLWSPKN